ncbi:hypothetical protein NLX86_20190 [Streptomyces sp. A3M-1-3]|uniref:D-alanyl-D-alanine carboxypeptidase n=1 Tax=Streptomyces sp. A3M-1-3 TaxID=2962044 RepID=UPI0020B88E28|nr:hypothetical protein [Streptomyces sp. A3M-1-3]MCP3820332.1 hypothetical protein [Streptomyces sp. A3M-1-3]
MEEASVAGESPDKSEQQRSSGESAPAERDPRLSVFREPKQGTDQPTAVFKMPRPAEATDAPAAGDSRLRAAVAAWVATADEPPSGAGAEPAPEAPEDASRPAAGPDADAEVAAGREPEAAAGADADAESYAQTGAESATKPSPEAGAEDAARASKAAVDAESSRAAEPARDSRPVARAEPDPGADATDTSRPAAGAESDVKRQRGSGLDDVVRPADRKPKPAADAEPGSEAKDAVRTDAPAGREAQAAAEVDVPAAREPKSAADAVPAPGSRSATEAEPDAKSVRSAEGKGAEHGSRAARGETQSDRSAADAASGEARDAAAEPDRSSGASAGQDAAGASAKRVDQATAVFKAVRPPAPKPEPAADQATTAFRAVRPSAPKPELAADQGATASPAKPEPTADQATTAFKAVRPPAAKPEPAADQATASAAKPEPAADQGTTAFKAVRPPAAQPAPGAERAGKFVPLKAQAPAPAPASRPLGESERTKQQPLPPKPPLDLLAELTNTPPPAPTPVRTAVWRVKIWTPLVLLLAIVFAVVQLVRPLPDPQLSMTAKSTFAFEGDKPSLPWPAKGQAFMAASGLGTVGSSGEQKPVPIASVTKAMTAYVILKNHPLREGEDGPSIEIDAKGEAEGQLDKSDGESTLNTVKEGDKLTLHDAIAAIMIPSANNIARQLARWDAGSEEAFVKKMNEAAKELGMTNTTYTDPSGLNATTVSTAEDQVKLGLELVEIPALMDITKLPEWKDPSGKNWRNWNELVPFDGALGIKTGSTTKAGGNLLFAAHKPIGGTDQLIVGAVLAQHDTPILGTAIKASKDIMLATQELLESRVVVKKGDVVGHVDDGLGGTTPVVATKDVNAVGWPGLTVKIELTDGGSTVPHSARAGTDVGTLTVGEGASQVKVPVALQQDLAEPSFGDKLTRVA